MEGRFPRYLPSGHLVYQTGGTMMAARFDPERLELLGTPIAVLDGASSWSLADDGKLFYTNSGTNTGTVLQLVWVSRDGEETPVDPNWSIERGPDPNHGWSISPDGSMVAIREFTPEGYDIWVKRLDTGPFSRLTLGDSGDKIPIWEPGTSDVTFLSDRNGNHDVWSRRADRAGVAELLLDAEDDLLTIDWSPDGQYILLVTSAGNQDILAFRPGVDSVPTPLFTGEYRERDPAVSPDGRWIAYSSDETGGFQIYVHPFPEVGAGRRQVSIDGGFNPKWAHSGREIFFEGPAPTRSMMAVEVETDTSFLPGTPVALFRAAGLFTGSSATGTVYDIAPDDQRFLLSPGRTVGGLDGGTQEQPSVILVNKFIEELKRMVPD